MTKVWNYVVIITGLSILLALAGIEVAGFTDLFSTIGLTTSADGISDFQSDSSFWNVIFGTSGLLILLGASGAIGIGTFIYTQDKSFLMIPIITGTLFYWISVMGSIVNYVKGYPVFGTIIGVIMIVLTIGFIQSCVEWFLGIDN
jgi:hypothetical protein